MRSPSKEWKIIADEKGGMPTLFFNFLLPFIILIMLACFIGYGVVGSKQSMFGLVATEKLGFKYAFYYAALFLISIFAAAAAVSFLAYFFHATNDFGRNLKLIAYSFTPTMAAALLLVIPALAPFLFVASVYDFVLLHKGLTPITKVQPGNKWGYFAFVAALLIFIFLAVSKILTRIIIN